MWKAHPAWRGACRMGGDGFTGPDPAELEPITVSAESREVLAARGVRIDGDPGDGNVIWLPRAAGACAIRLRFAQGVGGNVVVAGAYRSLGLTITFGGRDNLAIFVGGWGNFHADASFTADTCGLFAGRDTSAGGAHVRFGRHGHAVQIGDEGMFSSDVRFQAGEAHALIDLDRGAVAPPAAPGIVVEPYVWLQAACRIGNGVSIGRGAMVGGGAHVMADVPPRCLVVGVPARIARERVTWTRQAAPAAAAVRRALALAGLSGPVDDAT